MGFVKVLSLLPSVERNFESAHFGQRLSSLAKGGNGHALGEMVHAEVEADSRLIADGAIFHAKSENGGMAAGALGQGQLREPVMVVGASEVGAELLYSSG